MCEELKEMLAPEIMEFKIRLADKDASSLIRMLRLADKDAKLADKDARLADKDAGNSKTKKKMLTDAGIKI